MNKRLYRVIFNTSRGLWMVVAENAGSHGGGSASVVDAPVALRLPMARLTGIAFAALVMTGAAMSFLPAARAQIIADPGVPKAQQPVIVNTANGLPQVNIQTPSAAGVSRNTYTQFDVQKQGAILNNSRTNVQTQLGGWVQSNPNLANGTARVILNEVNSSNPSYLRGFIEVAGDRAQVIVANPSGVTCDGCGFINANRSTLTTGTVIMNGGNLDGYLVRGGSVIVEGAGMDDRQTDFTDIIARATQINAGLWSKTLRVTSGTNQVNADNTQATRISAADAAPLFGVDVAQLGGMYANKIVMVGTEAGVGVRNAGTIGAAAGEVTITADGRIENSGSLAAQERLSIRATSQQGALSNTGSIRSVGAAVAIQTDAAVDNTNTIAAQTDVNIVAAAVQNSGTASAATGNLAVDTSGTIDNSGRLIAAGDIKVAARQPVAGSGASDLRNSGSIEAGGLATFGTDGDLRNDGSITAQRVQTDAQGMINNGSIGARGNVALDLQKGLQQGSTGLLAATGDVTIALSGDYINAGRLQANKLTLDAANIDNQTGASLQAKEIVLNAVDWLDNAGEISASQKLAITATTFANTSVALGGDVVVQAKTLDNIGMNALLGAGNSMSLWVTDVINNRGKSIIYSGGDMAIAANSQRDANGLINAIGQITNEDSVVEAGGNLDVAAVNITNSRSNVLVNNITTVDERRTLVMPSWWHAGDNHAYYDPYSTNYSAHEYYYVNPADVLENTTVVTPDGYVIGRAVIRTHANDTAFMRDTGGGWAAYGTVRRVTVAEGTRVLYYTTSSTGVSNPDKVPGGDNLANGGVQWSMLPTYSDQYGSCTNDCIRFVTEPGYTDPNSIILRDTQRVIGVDTDTLEYWRHAHHVAVEDRLAAGAGVASEIRAGGNARIAIGQSLQNQFSNIVVNGTLSLGGAGADITNSGQTLYRRHYFDGTFVTNGGVTVGYSMPSIAEVIGTTQGAIVGRQGLDIVARNFSNADLSAGSAANIRSDVTLTTGSGQSVGGLITDVATRPDATAPGTPVPVKPNPMFTPATGGNYLLETRSQFTDHRTWLSSDYLLMALNVDPATTQKRLGDGFYEQRLVREQLGQLTGRVTGSANDDSQYQSLLNSAVSFAKAWDLRPGVALTSEQIGHLTSDIVWLETQKVSLPDGTTEDVLVPKVYLAHVDQDALKSNGALVSGSNITINAENITNRGGLIDGRADGTGRTVLVASNDLTNLGGGISGDEIVISAGRNVRNETLTVTETYATAQNHGSFTSVSNQAGIAAGKNLTISAGRDIDNVGGLLISGETMAMNAGRDINFSTAKTGSSYEAAFDGFAGNAHSVGHQGATVSVGGNLTLVAQRDIGMSAAQVAIGTAGQGSGSLLAGRAVTIGAALSESASEHSNTKSDSFGQAENQSVSVTGTQLSAADGLSIMAGLQETADVKVAASNITAGKALAVRASGNISILNEQEGNSHSEFGYSTTKSVLSSKTDTNYAKRAYTNAVGSTLSGDATVLQAGKDMDIIGSNVVSSIGTTLTAGNNITLGTSRNTFEDVEQHNEKTSGLFSGGGIGVTIGNREMDAKSDQISQTAVSSTVGSIAGNVTIQAGNAYAQTGSNIIAMQGDVDVTAKSILVNEAQNVNQTIQSYSLKQSGISLALTSPIISAIQTGQQIAAASQATGDTRMQVLAGATAALAGKNLYDAVAANPAQAGGINLSISLGASKSQNNSETGSVSAAGSSIAAGGNVTLKATGAGAASDITVQGSSIKAGENLTLEADDQINLLAAKNTADQHSNNSSSAASIGISIGSNGLLFNVGASLGRGNADGSDVSYTNATVSAGNKLTMISGGDANLIGAVASGKQVVADIGGDLNIQSLQDTSKFDSKQKNIGLSLSVGMGAASGSINYSNSTINSDFASVMEQSGIKAGDAGFQIKVDGNTDLKGAVIASTDTAVIGNKNSLTTASLTQSDIHNSASYSGDSVGIGVGYSTSKENSVGKDQQGQAQAGGEKVPGTELPTTGKDGGFSATPPASMSASGNASSTTRSGISSGAITVTNEQQQQQLSGQTGDQAIASVNRDVSSDKDGSNALKPIFNEKEIQAGFSIVTALTREMGTFLNNRAKEADDKLKAAKRVDALAHDMENGLNDEQRQALRDQAISLRDEAAQINDSWGAGGVPRQISTALMAAASGNVTGANAQFIDNMVINYVQQQGAEYIGSLVSKGLLTEGSPLHAALHGILACAGSAASGQSCSSGAAGAAVSSLLTGLFSETDSTETSEQREAKRNLIISLVTGIASASNADTVAATNSAMAAVDNNWLASQQIVQMNQEMSEAKTLVEKLKVQAKWAGTSMKQDVLTTIGVGKGLAESGWNDAKGLSEFMLHPIDGLNGLKEIISSSEARTALGERLYSELNTKIERMKLALEQGGDQNAEQFGKDIGALLWQAGSLVTGVSGIAKGGVELAKLGINVGTSGLKALANLAKFDALVASGGLLGLDGKPLMDFSKLTNAQKGIVGEIVGPQIVKNLLPDAEKIGRTVSAGQTGIDDLYKVNKPGVDFVVVEYKFGSSALKNTADGLQMSDNWITGAKTGYDRILEAVGGDSSKAAAVQKSLDSGRIEKWVVHTDPAGGTSVWMVDSAGKVIKADSSVVSQVLGQAK